MMFMAAFLKLFFAPLSLLTQLQKHSIYVLLPFYLLVGFLVGAGLGGYKDYRISVARDCSHLPK